MPKMVQTQEWNKTYAIIFVNINFDDDDLLSRSDLKEILNRLKVIENHLLDPQDWEEILDYVMEDGDIDEDGFIAFTEFSHIMQRVADFASTFVIRL
ncbi:hypothetical protein AVEN_247494-1 [Araneus ventricosus]|uniref:EF-hand domain-containing protein n=1 Tax=Araneus ventricosus TaxID=182803 RepID=A0A4Y2GVT4_ARAVE|nr:hypothetical protein AVEN_247494-1 [Araneus ventricosus]